MTTTLKSSLKGKERISLLYDKSEGYQVRVSEIDKDQISHERDLKSYSSKESAEKAYTKKLSEEGHKSEKEKLEEVEKQSNKLLKKLKADENYENDDEENTIFENLLDLGYDWETDNDAFNYFLKATSQERVEYVLENVLPKLQGKKGSKKEKTSTKINFDKQDVNDVLSDETEKGQSKTNFQRFASIIKKHPLIKDIYSDNQTGAIILVFKGKKSGEEVYATPFYEGEKDIPIYIDKDGETVIDSKIVNTKTEFDNLEDFSNWYYNKINEINKIAFPKENKVKKKEKSKSKNKSKLSSSEFLKKKYKLKK